MVGLDFWLSPQSGRLAGCQPGRWVRANVREAALSPDRAAPTAVRREYSYSQSVLFAARLSCVYEG